MIRLELREALDGLFAYDTGSVDSGIRDEDLRTRCIEELEQIMGEPDQGRFLMSWLLREMWLSPSALEAGYGYEDMLEFIGWLGERMEIDLRPGTGNGW